MIPSGKIETTTAQSGPDVPVREHLPIVSAAPQTKFATAQLKGPHGLSLWLDGNQKITAGNGTYDDPKPNALSLVAVDDCPGSTNACRAACYVAGLEDAAPDVAKRYQQNSKTLRRILAGDNGSSLDWAELLAAWISDNARGGFRWHVSGDVFSELHAHWIAQVARRSSDVVHWIYTRSFAWIGVLADSPVVVNISADRDNEAEARAVANRYDLRVCYMASSASDLPIDPDPGDVLFPDYALRRDDDWLASLPVGVRRGICPVDFFGKSEHIRCGVCRKCMR